ncbi:ribokinase [Agrobacterium tumefaciens]|jgi:ribokinase|uniref:Ribokinase n=1 Tax=Agrobacterium tumefaciens TaxID=358 RepID=A0AAW8M1M1_AGRTU|nr:ribokinase [Agrobacterium tumefaciens]MBP2542452.1 ribokinase [Agrobacterium tumefaciens]MBP2567999.1 ribokinase [Agrobacterium tumefaciens]MDP9874109.1 ribokinase [Agrobacterium tumefaciens]MDP9978705.1 ribokinase [Agrobacterium tumefaciens]MDR6704904.1 ribokinase [Agrobacterium tumefaciens]
MKTGVSILGIFVADTAYLAPRMPALGETITGSGFSVGPGGKGSNQAVAAARAGAQVSFISKIGRDTFGDLALKTYEEAGVTAKLTVMDDQPTGAAFIYVNDSTGDNAIIVYAGAAGTIGAGDVEAARDTIAQSSVFVTQLEQPVEAARYALEIARGAGVTTIFNPAPAEAFPEDIYSLCDFIIPNETEAAALVGFPIDTIDHAERAGEIFLSRGVGVAIITLGGRGVLFHAPGQSVHVPAVSCGPTVDTTGAGDAFVGGFAAALSRGAGPLQAVRFGCTTAGIAVTRRGTAPAMPMLSEIEAVMAR